MISLSARLQAERRPAADLRQLALQGPHAALRRPARHQGLQGLVGDLQDGLLERMQPPLLGQQVASRDGHLESMATGFI